MERIDGKIYLVTGAGSGIGAEIAHRLTDLGATVYAAARHLPAEYMAKNGSFIPMVMDVTEDVSVRAGAEKILTEQGTIYGVVNCAGSGIAGALEDCSPDEVLQQLNINAVGALRVTQPFLETMRTEKAGVIINIGSIGGDFPLPYQGTYSMAKAALRKETEVLRLELGKFGIQACVIEPGDMKTGFTAARRYSAGTPGSVHEASARRAVNQMAKDEQNGSNPRCVADLVVKLLKKKRLPACVPVGGIYVCFPVLSRLLPYRAVEKILGMMYHVKD